MNIDVIKEISLRGRVAFGVSCFENTLIYLKYDLRKWRIVLEYLWEFTEIEFLDDWIYKTAEIIPENLLEFTDYDRHEFEYISKYTFDILFELYQNIDEKIDAIMTLIFDIGSCHTYSIIEGYGVDSFNATVLLIEYMGKNRMPIPEITAFAKYSINGDRGFGEVFNYKDISKLL